eukprot:TRINITY_DN5472_c0_g1_i1.p1 TRINITY_DN5472_c0_g1~~TRINITY_DN5472_c0_g1_i1.p1  ORF type:complete len:696 (-),score=165.76 TRINITY_DN5472_c0_g1_i1:1-1947(-)
MNESISASLIGQPINSTYEPFSKAFLEIQQWEDISSYMQGVLLPALTQDEDYSGNPVNNNGSYFLMNTNRILGAVRIKQHRVAPNSCRSLIQNFTSEPCYASLWDESIQSTEAYGPNQMFRYYDEDKDHQIAGGASILGYVGGWYPSGGFCEIIPLTNGSQRVKDQIQSLIDNQWWDKQTRVIIININFLNIGLDDRIAVLYLMMEMPASGMVSTAFQIKTFRVSMYISGLDWFRLVMEILFVIILVFYLYTEVSEIVGFIRTRGSVLPYFRSMWNIIELLNLALFFSSLGMYARYLYSINHLPDLTMTDQYIPELEELAVVALQMYNLSAINILLSTFRTFKFLRLNSRLYVLWKALDRAGADLGSFLFMFLIIALGFLLMGLLTFGPDSANFNTFVNAFGTCWNFVIGNPPDYQDISTSNRVLGPLFFALFTIFIFFVLVNMFIAILNDAYSAVHKDVPKSGGMGRSVQKQFGRISNYVKLLLKGQRPLSDIELLRRLKHPEILEKSTVNMDDMMEAIGEGATHEYAKFLLNVHRKFYAKSMEDFDDSDEDDYDDVPATGGTPVIGTFSPPGSPPAVGLDVLRPRSPGSLRSRRSTGTGTGTRRKSKAVDINIEMLNEEVRSLSRKIDELIALMPQQNRDVNNNAP